eukprot:s1322_g13.t1
MEASPKLAQSAVRLNHARAVSWFPPESAPLLTPEVLPSRLVAGGRMGTALIAFRNRPCTSDLRSRLTVDTDL